MTNLSVYVLTRNSEKYLEQVLDSVREVADEILILDSGSEDRTREISEKCGARFEFREFDNFKNQRNAAQDLCLHDWIFFLDSDEVLDAEMQSAILDLKKNDFIIEGKKQEAFQVRRRWFLFGQEVHAFLPVSAPDYPTRIYPRSRVRFGEKSSIIHETPEGYESTYYLHEGAILHYSCDSVSQLFSKLNLYTDLAAEEMQKKGKKGGLLRSLIHGEAAAVKWFFRKGSWRDGRVGVLLSLYAFVYVVLKYLKITKFEKTS